MNDYRFGNYIFEKRKLAGLSQRQVAMLTGVSDKAVSKWENGKAKPTTNILRKLATLFQVPVEELLQMREEKENMSITKIVITGGPSAGKTTGLSWIQNAFTKLGYTVLFVPETATELITGGVAPWTCDSNLSYQKCQMRLQLEKERVFEQAARSMKADKILIVCDRGAIDNKAYMSELEFAQVLAELGTTEVQLRDSYDAVFHMVTAAKGAERFYTTDNNKARTETAEQAAALDDKLISAWTGHPHLRIIDNSSNFEDKLKRLIAEIRSFLGEPEPLEIERKFLIEYPDVKWLESLPNCRKVDIIQTYLISNSGDEIRVRQRGENGSYMYYKTVKRHVSETARIEIEERLSQSAYLTLLMEADPSKRPIRKTRYCLTYENKYFEIDLYPFWDHHAIVEIELSDEAAQIQFPKELKIIREVTADERYKNASLAAATSEELAAEEKENDASPVSTASEELTEEEMKILKRFIAETLLIDGRWGTTSFSDSTDSRILSESNGVTYFESCDMWNYHDESWTEYEQISAHKISQDEFERNRFSRDDDKLRFGRVDLKEQLKGLNVEVYVQKSYGCDESDKSITWNVKDDAYLAEIPGLQGPFHISYRKGSDR